MNAPAIDGEQWLRRWDAQQQLHLPYREQRFAVITDALAAIAGASPRVLDLGSGPGSLSLRVLSRLPDAQVVAIDADPVLLAIGRTALGHERRIHFVDADLRGDWAASLPIEPPFDAAVSTTALHWLDLPGVLVLYTRLAQLLRPGGVFLDGDRFDFGHDQAVIDAAAQAMSEAQDPSDAGGAEDWNAWWEAAGSDPALAGAMGERRKRRHEHPHDGTRHTLEFHQAALLGAGFAEVATVWQRLTDRVLIAIR